MVRSLASYLVRFDAEPAAPVLETPMEVNDDFVETHVAQSHDAAIEAQTRIYELAYAAAKEEFGALLESERQLFAQRLSDERSRWVNEEGGRLSEAFRCSINENIEALRSTVEKILEPFVARSVLEALIDDFVKTTRAAVGDTSNPVIQFSGPRDLLEIISAKLSKDNIAARIADYEGVEVRAKIGPTTIETRFAEWLRHIRGEE